MIPLAFSRGDFGEYMLIQDSTAPKLIVINLMLDAWWKFSKNLQILENTSQKTLIREICDKILSKSS